jgi:chromosome segregation ATPase
MEKAYTKARKEFLELQYASDEQRRELLKAVNELSQLKTSRSSDARKSAVKGPAQKGHSGASEGSEEIDDLNAVIKFYKKCFTQTNRYAGELAAWGKQLQAELKRLAMAEGTAVDKDVLELNQPEKQKTPKMPKKRKAAPKRAKKSARKEPITEKRNFAQRESEAKGAGGTPGQRVALIGQKLAEAKGKECLQLSRELVHIRKAYSDLLNEFDEMVDKYNQKKDTIAAGNKKHNKLQDEMDKIVLKLKICEGEIYDMKGKYNQIATYEAEIERLRTNVKCQQIRVADFEKCRKRLAECEETLERQTEELADSEERCEQLGKKVARLRKKLKDFDSHIVHDGELSKTKKAEIDQLTKELKFSKQKFS